MKYTYNEFIELTVTFKGYAFGNSMTYRKWRTEWKAQYAQISDNIRRERKSYRDEQRKRGYAYPDRLNEERRKANELLRRLYLAKAEARWSFNHGT